MTTPPAPKLLSPQEWETLFEDYNHGRLHRWSSSDYSGPTIVDLALTSLLRKDFSLQLKLHLLIFLEEHSRSLFASPSSLSRLLETLRLVIQSPNLNDAVSLSFSLKEQFLISTTSVFIVRVTAPANDLVESLEGLVELLLTIINRPNHGIDRQIRAIACECLRELELAFPCLLSEIAACFWAICQNERTHAAQSYILLLAAVMHSIVVHGKAPNVSVLNTSTQLIPFKVPHILAENDNKNDNDVVVAVGDDDEKNAAITSSNLKDMIVRYKEFRRVISFLLEWRQYLTPGGVLEFMRMTMPVANALELQASLLKVQFSGLIYTFDPLLSHAYLGMYLRFLDSFDGQDMEIANRLVLQSKELSFSSQNNVVFRLLSVHWLLGLIRFVVSRDVRKKRSFVDMMNLSFYPAIFDPLALKSLKLDLAAYCSVLVNYLGTLKKNAIVGTMNVEVGSEVSVVKLLDDGLMCVSGFKWLPPWSTETAVAFRTFHKFLVGASSHFESNESDSSSNRSHMDSPIFCTVQSMLIESTLKFQGLVPLIVSFIDRLLGCYKHCCVGEWLLETFNESFLPKLKIDYKLGSYFPILERISLNDKVSPIGLLELLGKFMVVLIKEHGPDTGLKSWCQGSKVLGICRTMLMHHHSSSLFLGLSRLLAFTCLYFPDLEVRDQARTYLRMLICIPGKKLQDLLNIGEQLPGISPSTHSSSFFIQSPGHHDVKKSRNILSYIHLERTVPLLVRQSWSLSLPVIFNDDKHSLESFEDDKPTAEAKELDRISSTDIVSDINMISQLQEPLRVMDSKVSEIVGILRKHFSSIPDFRHFPGLKIQIPCGLRFNSELFNHLLGTNLSTDGCGVDSLPAIYATVLKFTSSAPYGSIPSYHIPFLLAQPAEKDYSFSQTNSLEIVPIKNGFAEEKRFRAHVMIELEPQEPQPGLIDVYIQTNAENGLIIRGQLHSVNVGIEDMFLKAIVPEDLPKDAVPNYFLDLFNALWEACGTSSCTGRETFVLKGGKGVAAINGTQSVKLLEVPFVSLIQAVERFLAPFVVSVTGETLINIVKGGEIIKDVAWEVLDPDSTSEVLNPDARLDGGPLYIQYMDDENDNRAPVQIARKNMGSFLVLIFLPPRFHLLFKMEVCDVSTLVRVRTDHWPCLAYVDEFLEALFIV
ncbi:hypothetical protein ACH5RR_013025 [Cinchona calisaya]|uniref:AP-5 complex subunit beta-1 n=1 Tax=Cinchona calisaya TaxID=153742 RepID=A0ABD2ZZC1_9GENT